MPRGQSYWDAKARYQREKRKLISADVPKEIGERYRVFAAQLGESMSGLIRRAVDEFIARHVGTAGEFTATNSAALHGDETPPQPAETTEIGASGEGIPITFAHVDQTAQNQPVSAKVQTIVPAAETAPNRITAADKRLFDAVNALSPESKKALLKFLATLQG